MKNMWKRFLVTSLTLLVVLSGCDSALEPQPDQHLTPEAAMFAKGGKSTANGAGNKGKSEAAKERRRVKGSNRKGQQTGWIMATGTLPMSEELKSEVLVDGSRTTTMRVADHTLVIPAGAVTQPTWFKMASIRRVGSDGEVEVSVSLKAERILADGTTLSVGEHGFAVPLELRMSTSWANKSGIAPGTLPTVLWLVTNDTVVEANVVQSNDEGVIVKLDHFSDYGLAWPE